VEDYAWAIKPPPGGSRLGSAEAGDDHVDDVAHERVVEWLVTIEQAVVGGAIQEIQGDLGIGAVILETIRYLSYSYSG
jgi:hypothetical protein